MLHWLAAMQGIFHYVMSWEGEGLFNWLNPFSAVALEYMPDQAFAAEQADRVWFYS